MVLRVLAWHLAPHPLPRKGIVQQEHSFWLDSYAKHTQREILMDVAMGTEYFWAINIAHASEMQIFERRSLMILSIALVAIDVVL